MRQSQKIKSITLSKIQKEVKKLDSTIALSAVGIGHIINSPEFWLEFPLFVLNFIKKYPKIQDKRNKKVDNQTKNSQD